MPLVRVTARYNVSDKLEALGHALWEIVPAAMNSEQGKLTPGSICYISGLTDTDLLTVDVFIEVEAYHYEDRHANLWAQREAHAALPPRQD